MDTRRITHTTANILNYFAEPIGTATVAMIASDALYKIHRENDLPVHNHTNTSYALISSSVNAISLSRASLESLVYLAACMRLLNKRQMAGLGIFIVAGMVFTISSMFHFNDDENVLSTGILAAFGLFSFNTARFLMKERIQTGIPAHVEEQAAILQNISINQEESHSSQEEVNEHTSLYARTT